jgi:hypothetical protein
MEVAVVASAETTAPELAFTLDPLAVVQLVIAFVLPALIGLVTTRVISRTTKAWLLAGLSLVTSLLIELARALADAATFDVGVALLTRCPRSSCQSPPTTGCGSPPASRPQHSPSAPPPGFGWEGALSSVAQIASRGTSDRLTGT